MTVQNTFGLRLQTLHFNQISPVISVSCILHLDFSLHTTAGLHVFWKCGIIYHPKKWMNGRLMQDSYIGIDWYWYISQFCMWCKLSTNIISYLSFNSILSPLCALCRWLRTTTTPHGCTGMESPFHTGASPPFGPCPWPSSPSVACCPPSAWALSQSGLAGRDRDQSLLSPYVYLTSLDLLKNSHDFKKTWSWDLFSLHNFVNSPFWVCMLPKLSFIQSIRYCNWGNSAQDHPCQPSFPTETWAGMQTGMQPSTASNDWKWSFTELPLGQEGVCLSVCEWACSRGGGVHQGCTWDKVYLNRMHCYFI